MDSAHIRPAEENDLAGILEIYNHAIIHTTAVYNYNAHTLDMRRQWWEEKKLAGQPILVAVLNNQVLGFASYGPFRAWAAYKYSFESSVYIHPNFQGKGLGKKLVQQLIEVAKKDKVHTLVAGIDAENQASIILHQKLGFEAVGHFKQVGYKFGRWLDLVFYQLLLDGPENPEDF